MSREAVVSVKPYILFPLTPLHAGSGRAVAEAVDLPVQKDAFGCPVIWASSLKGALRSSFRTKRGGRITLEERAIFGPEIGEGGDYASALDVLEARLLAMSTRSLKGVYAYVTMPHLLERAKILLEYLEAYGVSKRSHLIGGILEEGTPVATTDKLLVNEDMLVLAEEPITDVKVSGELRKRVSDLIKNVRLPIEGNEVADRFVVVDDNIGKSLIRKSLTTSTRVALDYAKKTVRRGALWTEEYVPEMALLYTAMQMTDAKIRSEELRISKAKDLLEELLMTLGADDNGNFYLVLGGHETVGKGIVKFCSW